MFASACPNVARHLRPSRILNRMFHRKPPGRVLEYQSTREIADAMKRQKCGLRAAVYLYDESRFIISPIAGNTEYDEPVVLDADVSNEDLGLAVCDALIAYRNDNPRRKAGRLADWAAYRASGATSGNAFERNCWFVYVRTINTAIRMEAGPRISNNPNLVAAASAPSGTMHVGLGQLLRKAIDAARVLRKEGLV